MTQDLVQNLISNLEVDTTDTSDIVWGVIQKALKGTNIFGDFVRFICIVPDNKAVSVFVGSERFSDIKSILEQLQTQKDEVKVPLFLGVDKKYHVSYRALSRLESDNSTGATSELNDDYGTMVDIKTTVPLPIKNIIKTYAKENDMTVSGVVRKLILGAYKDLL